MNTISPACSKELVVGQKAFEAVIQRIVDGVVECDGGKVASCFTADGVYRDVFYGESSGRAAIVDLVENRFHRDACDFKWDLHDPVFRGETGYARFLCSYTPRISGATSKRVILEGVAILKLDDGLVYEYQEIVNYGAGLAAMNFRADRIKQILLNDSAALTQREEADGHY